MNETPFEKLQNSDDELQAEYRFDYQKAKPNRFASRSGTQQLTVVVLDGRRCSSGFHHTRIGQQSIKGVD
ncbi:hypothetical protein [Nostoc sp.]|uniref:hypothetical protein n=1 Tax=Nostoc sp. TaxID=1180 RepID=UPI002FFCB5DC